MFHGREEMALESEIKELNRMLYSNCKQRSYED